jgi:glyoxylase-like metal-dependent hydrolase (beta-lactamase superfamily II)
VTHDTRRDHKEIEMNEGSIGNVRITRIEEPDTGGPMEIYFTEEQLGGSFKEILGDYYDEELGRARQPINVWLAQDGDNTILFDTGIGDMPGKGFRDMWPEWPESKSHFLAQLDVAGFTPGDIDIVAITHLHFDHIGHFTREIDGLSRVTFPNARYLVGKDEYELTKKEAESGSGVPAFATCFFDQVAPVMLAGQVDLLEGVTKVSDSIVAVPAPGHSPGHYRYDIESRGEHGIIAGDIFHFPHQVERHLTEALSYDDDGDLRSRERLYADAADRDALVFPTHVFAPGVIRIKRIGDAVGDRTGYFGTIGWD